MAIKTNSIFDKFAAVFASTKAPTAADLAALLDKTAADLSEMKERLSTKIEELPEKMLHGDDARAAARTEIEVVRADIADTEMGISAIERRLEAEKFVEAEATRKAAYDRAIAARRDAAAKLIKQYPEYAAGLAALIEEIARADAAIEAANGNLPADMQPLQSVEAVARIGGHADAKVLKRETRDLWCNEGSTVPVSADFQDHISVEPGSGRGFVRQEAVTRTAPDAARAIQGTTQAVSTVTHFEKRRFVVTETIDSLPGVVPEPLASIALPGLRGGDAPYWLPTSAWSDADSVLRAVEARKIDKAEHRPTPERRVVTRYELVADPVADAAE